LSPRLGRDRMLDAVFFGLLAIAAVWLGYEFWRLLFQPRPDGAIDLYLRTGECQEWFEGVPIYETRYDAVYPPASYLLLWPLLGWSSLPWMRWLWLLPTLLSIYWLCRLLVQHGGFADRRQRRLLWALPLASYPVGATVGNGQLSILVSCCLFAGVMMLARAGRSWGRDLAVAGLLLAALVKPSVAAYFFWIPLFVPGGLRVACVVVAGYVVLTWLAGLAQDLGPVELMRAWLERATAGAEWGATRGGGAMAWATDGAAENLRIKSINLHSVLSVIGKPELIGPLSFVPLLLLGAWVWLRRRGHLLSLLGVSAIVARFSSYHGWYDDVIMLMPLVALLHWTHAAASGRARTVATWLSLWFALFLLAPGGIYALPPALANTYAIAQAVCWLASLVFLVSMTRVPYPDDRAVASATNAAYDRLPR